MITGRNHCMVFYISLRISFQWNYVLMNVYVVCMCGVVVVHFVALIDEFKTFVIPVVVLHE